MKKINLALLMICVLVFWGCENKQNTYISKFSKNSEIERKVDSLLKKMSLEEKIGQMSQFASNDDVTGPLVNQDIDEYLKKGLIGSILNVTNPDKMRRMQEAALNGSKHGIPLLFGYDVIHGYKTIFPIPLAESCSWDLELIEKTAAIGAEEAAVAGINWTFSPMVDITRDPRWGRVMEGSGEDTYLGSLIAKARVTGIQGKDWSELNRIDKILACAKHFCGYGASEGGRDYNSVDLSERALREIYFPPFEAAKNAGVATFMTAFNDLSGIPCSANKYLYQTVLRDEWQFQGFVVTDYRAINELIPHGIASNEKEAALKTIHANIDMDMTGGVFLSHLAELVKENKVSMKQIDESVGRILEMKYLLGLFDDPFRYMDSTRREAITLNESFLQYSRYAAQRSMVLLKNENNYFPIKKDQKTKIALIGPMIMEKNSMIGEWAAQGDRDQSISIYDGINSVYENSNIEFIYAKGSDYQGNDKSQFTKAIKAALSADKILVAMGEDFNETGEAASVTSIGLPGVQQDLLKELVKLNKPIGLILLNGRPLDLSWETENLDAILEAWYPGTMGGFAIADVVCGDYNPSGKLTMSFPRNVGQIPVYYNHKNTGRPRIESENVDYCSFYRDQPNTPLFPFGYGLNYSDFSISNLNVDKCDFTKGDTITLSVFVENKSEYPGEEVVQLYIQDIVADITRPVKELKSFHKIYLDKNESKEVIFRITEDMLRYYNQDYQYLSEPGYFKIWVGNSSDDNEKCITVQYN